MGIIPATVALFEQRREARIWRRARNEHRHDLALRNFCLLAQHGIVVVGDRMLYHRERIALQSVQAAHRLRGARKAVGDDRDGRDAEPLCFDRVVQTARRAAPSIADCGENGVRSAHLH
jgi:hypothetical protein